MPFNWDNFSNGNNIDNNIMGQFQQFMSQMQNGGLNNMQGQISQIQNMMRMMNCKSPKQLAMLLMKNKGIDPNMIGQFEQMANKMLNIK